MDTYAKKQDMWRISNSKKKSIGSRKKREAAIMDLEALDAGAATSKIAHLSRLLAPMAISATGSGCRSEDKCCDHGCGNQKCSLQSHKTTKAKLMRELIGDGHNPSDSGRSFRRHRLAVVRALEKECGDDKLKQCQVASAIKDVSNQSTDDPTGRAGLPALPSSRASRAPLLPSLLAQMALQDTRLKTEL